MIRSGLAPRRFVVLDGVVLGAFHVSFETVIRFLPTATLGIVIACAVCRTGSIWVGALMRFRSGSAATTLAGPAGYDRRGGRR